MRNDSLTIGTLAARFGLSRSTLLYYDRIGLLRPAERTAGGYRRYGSGDVERLALICRYRRAGLPLEVVAGLLGAGGDLGRALGDRLAAIDAELARLRAQRQVVLDYLRGDDAHRGPLTAGRFSALLDQAGVGPELRDRWHATFEQREPDGHRAFLEFLGLTADEVARVRSRSAGPADG